LAVAARARLRLLLQQTAATLFSPVPLHWVAADVRRVIRVGLVVPAVAAVAVPYIPMMLRIQVPLIRLAVLQTVLAQTQVLILLSEIRRAVAVVVVAQVLQEAELREVTEQPLVLLALQ
jgi:hypothetical protein